MIALLPLSGKKFQNFRSWPMDYKGGIVVNNQKNLGLDVQYTVLYLFTTGL